MKHLQSPIKKDESTEMPKRSRMRDRMMAMIGGSSEPPKKDTKKKSSEIVSKGKDFLNIPLKDFSPQVRKMLVAGMVQGGRARVVKVKKTKEDKKGEEKRKLVTCRHRQNIFVHSLNNFFKVGRSFSFDDLIQVPTFIRKQTIRKKIFQSFWMTSDENFKIIKRIEQENAKKEADQKEKENIKKEAVIQHRKVKAAIKRKQIKNVAKKIKSNPKL